MGAPVKVTAKQIIEAGLDLQNEGVKVSEFKIRHRLGQQGRPDRIKKIWEDHVRQNELETCIELEQQRVGLPAEVEESLSAVLQKFTGQLTQLVTESYQVAHQTSEKRVHTTIKDYNQKIEEFEVLTKEASDSIENADYRIEQLETKLDLVGAKHSQLQIENGELRGQVKILTSQLESQKLMEAQINELSTQYGVLEKKLCTFRAP